MTKTLDEAISQLRAWPEADQDWAAENIQSLIRERDRGQDYQLTDDQMRDVQQTLDDLEAGRERLLTHEETEEMWRRLGA